MSTEIIEYLNLRRVLKRKENNQVQIDFRTKLGDADMTLEKALERALFIEAVKIIEEEDRQPRFLASSQTKLFNKCIRLMIQ